MTVGGTDLAWLNFSFFQYLKEREREKTGDYIDYSGKKW
jgi:hypothetical protein